MTDLLVVPSVMPTLTAWLADQDELASLPGEKVVTRLPKTKTWPIVRVTQFNDTPRSDRRVWWMETFVEVEVFAEATSTARAIAETCYALLSQRFPGIYDDLVVSAVDPTGLRDEPDTAFTPAQARWLFVASIFTRPNVSVGS